MHFIADIRLKKFVHTIKTGLVLKDKNAQH